MEEGPYSRGGVRRIRRRIHHNDYFCSRTFADRRSLTLFCLQPTDPMIHCRISQVCFTLTTTTLPFIYPSTTADSMAVDTERPQRVSTHGSRGSRREEWRKSKGMSARPNPHGMNRQGGVAARRKAGRSKRRR